jgi:peptide/nickel transport system permease protein
MAIPGLPLLIVLAVAVEPRNPYVVGLLLSVDAWAGLSRQLHSQVLALRSESYVEASRVVGLGSLSIVRDDILPKVMPYIMINFMGNAIRVIHASVGLYFLGVLPFTTQNWGVILHNAFNKGALFSLSSWHWLFLPIFVIALLGYGITIFSQGMDRLFNPRVRARESSTSSDDGAVPTE